MQSMQSSVTDLKHRLNAVRRQWLAQLLLESGGNLSLAARTSGLHRNVLLRWLKKLGLDQTLRSVRAGDGLQGEQP